MISIRTDSTKFTLETFNLPNWVGQKPLEAGEWVTVSDGKVARITDSDVEPSHNTFPVVSSNGAGLVTIPKGAYSFETDRYDKSATISAGTLLTVKGDGNTTQARGMLAPADPGDPIRAICEGKGRERNTITVRMLDGGATRA